MKTRYWVGGCLSTIILLVVIAGAAYYLILQASDELVETYTSPEPLDLAPVERVETEREEALSVIERLMKFYVSLETGEETGSLSLSADDINALLEYEDLLKEYHGMARVDIKGDKLQVEISLPLGMFNDRFEGRFLNGTGEISVEIKDDRLEVTIDRLEAAGMDIPEEFMNEIRKNNLVETLYQQPSVERFLQLVKSVKVEDGRLVIEPR